MSLLSGVTILVTRPARQAAGLVEPLEALGATVRSLPAIEIAPPEDPGALDAALRDLGRFDWLVLTSVNGVEAVRARLDALGSGLPGRLRLSAVGPSTAAAMREAFREPDFVPSASVGEAIAREMGDVAGRRFLLARADRARPELPAVLRARGGIVEEASAYRIVRPASGAALPEACPDWIALTSPSAVYGTRDALEAQGRGDWMRTARLACIGPTTAAAVRELRYEVAAMAEASTIPGLVAALVAFGRERAYAEITPSPTVPPPARASLEGEPSREGIHA